MKSSYLIWSLGETLRVDFAGEVFAEEKFAIFENCMDAPPVTAAARRSSWTNICFSLHLTLRLHCTFLNHFRHITCKK